MCEESRAGIKPISLLFILPAHKTSTSRRGHLWDQYAWCQIQQQTQSWSGAGNLSVSLMPGWSLGDDDDQDFDDRDDHNVDVDCQYIGDSPKCGSYITLSSSGRWKYWCHVIQTSNVGLTMILKAVSGKLSHVLFILFINIDVFYLLVMCSLFLTILTRRSPVTLCISERYFFKTHCSVWFDNYHELSAAALSHVLFIFCALAIN